jgi:hypothetical protein
MSVFGGAHDHTPSLHSESSSDEAPPSPPNDKSIVQQEVRSENFESDLESSLDSDAESDELQRKKPLDRKEIDAYRRWYTQETHLIDAFETARSGDLGRNLLGFASERQINLSKNPATNVAPWVSRYRWTDNQKTRDALPLPHWTTWPLPPDEVPPPHERFHGPRDDDNYSRQAKRRKIMKPSAEFEEALCDIAIQKAREKLNRVLESSKDAAAEEEESDTQLKTEPEFDPESDPNETNTTGMPLSLSADQDQTRDIVRPTIRSIMSKFDTLMTSLYRSRMNHRAHRSSSHDDEPQSFRPESSTSSEGEKKGALGLRDWSEVLGMASLTGWGPEVVGRAAQRCAKVFGEGMSFAKLDAENPSTEPFEYKPDMVPKFEEEEPWTLESLVCPHEDCSRNSRGFDEKRRLRWHIRDVHDWDPEVERQPPKIFGGAHLDGFMRQIPAQPGWRSKDKSKSERRGSKRTKEANFDIDVGLAEKSKSDD